MTTKAKSGVGAKVFRGDGASPEVFTAIAEVRTIDGPSPSASTLDATNCDSTGGYEELITGLKSAGTINIEMNFVGDDTAQAALWDDFDNGTASNYRIDYPDHGLTRFSFQAVVTSPPPAKVDPKQVMTGTCALRVTGPITRGTHT